MYPKRDNIPSIYTQPSIGKLPNVGQDLFCFNKRKYSSYITTPTLRSKENISRDKL